MNCDNCGAEINIENKFCEHCGSIVNPKGKDYSNDGNAFLITDIFKISNRAMIIGKPLQYIKSGDILCLNKKNYRVWNMQKGQSIVSEVSPEDFQVGITFENYEIKGLKKGVTLSFRQNEQ